MKLTGKKFFRLGAIAFVTFGILPGHSYADGQSVVINTNGNVDINGATHTVTITPDGNTPLIVNNVNLPGDQNLVINGGGSALPKFTPDQGGGPTINLVQTNPIQLIATTQAIQLSPEQIIAAQPKPVVSPSDLHQIPAILEMAHTTVDKPSQELNPAPYVHNLPSAGATLMATTQVSAAAASDPVLINTQNTQQASQMITGQNGEIVLN